MMYEKLATSNSPALIIFLIDIGSSMRKPMSKSTRIQVAKEATRVMVSEMVYRSLKQNDIRPRYRVGMIAYSDDTYDLLGGVKTIEVVAKTGIPQLEPQNGTDTTKGFHYVKKLIEREVGNISTESPAPLVIHITDGEFTSKEDPEPVVREIQQIMVPDGSVLVENIFVSEELKMPLKDIASWAGFTLGEDTGNIYGNHLLILSSQLPETYRMVMDELGFSIQRHSLMMYPCMVTELVQAAFVMSAVSRSSGW